MKHWYTKRLVSFTTQTWFALFASRRSRRLPFAITGNFLVFAVLLRNKTMRKTINFFIANMAISDSIFTLVYLPRVITILLFGYRWLLSDLPGMIFCRMLPFLVEISTIVSVLAIVAITLDRSLAVKFPLRASITTRTCVFVILVIWVIAISVQTPTLLATDLDEYQQKMYCIVDFDVKIWRRYGNDILQVRVHSIVGHSIFNHCCVEYRYHCRFG